MSNSFTYNEAAKAKLQFPISVADFQFKYKKAEAEFL